MPGMTFNRCFYCGIELKKWTQHKIYLNPKGRRSQKPIPSCDRCRVKYLESKFNNEY